MDFIFLHSMFGINRGANQRVPPQSEGRGFMPPVPVNIFKDLSGLRVRVFSAFGVTVVPVAEYTLAQILLAGKG